MSLGSCWRRFVLFLKNEQNDDPVQYRKQVELQHDIEFESLLAEDSTNQIRRVGINWADLDSSSEINSGSFVTEAEVHHIRSGNWDKLIEERERLNTEIDQKLTKEEEELRKEQEAYYAARKQAAKQKKLQLTQGQQSTSVMLHGGSGQSRQMKSRSKDLTSSHIVKEEDFDKFLKSMEARTSSMSERSGKSAFAVSDHSDHDDSNSDDDVDFGFWEKASDEDDKHSSSKVVNVN